HGSISASTHCSSLEVSCSSTAACTAAALLASLRRPAKQQSVSDSPEVPRSSEARPEAQRRRDRERTFPPSFKRTSTPTLAAAVALRYRSHLAMSPSGSASSSPPAFPFSFFVGGSPVSANVTGFRRAAWKDQVRNRAHVYLG